MPRTCSAEGCTNFCYGGGYCKYHQWHRRLNGGDLYVKTKAKEPLSHLGQTIHRRTPKRASDERYYAVQAKEFFDDAVKNGTNHCFFCGEKVNSFQGLHHLKGRVGKYLLDKLWWTIVHNKCHTEDYHSVNAEQRMRQPWWQDFLKRLRVKSEELYFKELKKIEKAGLLFGDD